MSEKREDTKKRVQYNETGDTLDSGWTCVEAMTGVSIIGSKNGEWQKQFSKLHGDNFYGTLRQRRTSLRKSKEHIQMVLVASRDSHEKTPGDVTSSLKAGVCNRAMG